jgi:hypothetical protein
MKLHASAIEELVSLFHVHGGTPDEAKLKKLIAEIDFTPYEQKTTPDQNMVLVMTKTFLKALNANRT